MNRRRLTLLLSSLMLCLMLAGQPANFLNNVYHYIENPEVFELNQQPGHAPTIPHNAPDKVVSLNGSWAFYLSQTPEASPKDFFRTDFDDSRWGRIKVPSNWQMEGYDTPLFRNIATPFKADPPFIPRHYNPVGSYRHGFEVPAGWKDMQVFLRFEGVASAFFLWINGQEVGYNQGAMEPAEFDITPYIKEGDNRIAVNVYQYSDGVYLEDQDMWRLAGIFRDVTIIARPRTHILDYFVITDFDNDYRHAWLDVNLQLRNYSITEKASGLKLSATLLDPSGQVVFVQTTPVKSVRPQATQPMALRRKIEAPMKWTAETPNLYDLILTLVDGKTNRPHETIRTRIGFRKVEIKNRALLINGIPVKLHGVNSHQQHPHLGHAMDEETIRRDFQLMKQLNINNVRTSHYPPTTRYLELADEYGLYVVDEVGNEAHATEYLSSRPQWLPAYLERVEKMVLRDRNHPGIIMWSAGNESGEGENICHTIARGKELDPTRPGWMYGANSNDLYPAMGMECEDIIGPRYPTPMEFEYRVARVPENTDARPAYMDEYLSATGNSMGALDEFWEIIHRYPRCIGGAIWDWVSPGLDAPLLSTPDRSPSGIDGFLMGNIIHTKSRRGKGITLSGNDEWVEFYRDPRLDITGKALSLSLWLKPGTWNGGKSILTKGFNQYGLRQLSAEEIEFYLHNGKQRIALTAKLPSGWEGQWHHVAAIYNGTCMQLYIDKEKIGEKEFDGRIANFPFQLNLGRDAEKEGMETRHHTLQAEIEHLSIYAAALPVQQLYNCDRGLLSGARLWIDFDEIKNLGRFYTLGIGARAYGIVWPDRTLQPEAMQIKKSGQPIRVEWEDRPSLTMRIVNRFSFTNLNRYQARFTLLKDGREADEWMEVFNVDPLQSLSYTFPAARIPQHTDAGEYHLQISFLQHEATIAVPQGYEIAWEELSMPWQQTARISASASVNNKPITTSQSDTLLVVTGDSFACVFHKTKGELISLQYNGVEYLTRGPQGNVWRAPLSNESDSWGNAFAHTGSFTSGMGNGPSNPWLAAGLDRLQIVPNQFEWKSLSNGSLQVTIRNIQQADNYTTAWEDTFIYTIASGGTIHLHHTLTPWGKQPAWIPRAGLQLILDKRFETMEWFGCGPEENYPDRKTGYKTGVYEMEISDMYVPYLQPQDYGNRCDIRYLILKDAHGNGLKVSGSSLFNASAQLTDTDNLTRAAYPFQLNRTGDVTLNIDYETSGVGCNSISTVNKYRVFPRQYEFTTIFEPMSCSMANGNKAVVDDLNDLAKLHSYTSGLVIEKDVESNIYDFDSVLKLDDATSSGEAVYHAPAGIKTLLIHTYRERRSVDETLRFFVSEDGREYSLLNIDSRIAPKQAYPHWQHIIYEKNFDVASYKYLRIEMHRGSKFSPCIGSMNINAEEDTEYINEYRGYTPAAIVDAIRKKHPGKGHPRIKAVKADFDNMRLWHKTDDYFAKSADRTIQRADKMLDEPVITYEIDPQGYLLFTARTVLGRMETLGLAWQLTGNKKYVERAWKDLEAAANFQDWRPDHYLDTAEMTCAFAYAYDWMYDAWSDDQRLFIRQTIVERGLKTAWDVYSGRCVWYSWENNMNTVNNSGIALGALAVADEEPELAGKIILEALKSIQHSIVQYAPDGAYREGPNYWGYGTKYLVNFIAAIETSLGTDLGLSETQGLEVTGDFPSYATGPTGTFNYADGGRSKPSAIEQLWFARRYNQKGLAWHFRNEGKLPGLLYYSPDLFSNPEDAQNFPLDRYFKGVELVTFRSAWFDNNATFVGFKAGTPQESHGDMDMGTFVLDALGERWAIDFGPENYNAPGIWEWQGKPFGARYNYYRKNPEGHNCVLVAPDSGLHQKGLAFSPIIRTSLNGAESAFAIADLTPAYERTAHEVKRGIMLLNDRKDVLIQDEVVAHKPSSIWWFMHTKADIKIQTDDSEAILTQNGKHLYMKILSPAGASFREMKAEPMPGSPKGERETPNDDARKIAIHLEDMERATISVLLIPLTQYNEKEYRMPGVKELKDW